eukprot:CAMPEP_0185581928 /NCGR_PEP_ID=MMETSP0434-20130131/19364_1 /TAXON_ID=626734 ORGANISM="Favella taraikaensis, Strain Fe Narragansett Bay" /NCGR_SAMPLE_ID=MMETSP0434 /ASSEMBLY_ACC=CAM_ASM_000379 /LENGTH=30 /DNA_ID= /DNA_START= /DNA_END= /DNA_ORIENTATION=
MAEDKQNETMFEQRGSTRRKSEHLPAKVAT